MSTDLSSRQFVRIRNGASACWRAGAGALALAAVLGGVGGCVSPLDQTQDEMLRRQLLGANRAMMNAASAGGEIEVKRVPSRVDTELKEKGNIEQLDEATGPKRYRNGRVEPGADLTGNLNTPVVKMTLQRALMLSALNNLQVESARLAPAISETQVLQAEAAFDAVFFTTLNQTMLDQPRPPSIALPVFGGAQITHTFSLATGIRKPLSSGGQVTVQADITRNASNPTFFALNPYYNTDVLITIAQPLLRNFGTDVNRSQILLAQSARDQNVFQLQQTLLSTIGSTETAYWNLYFARQQLLIQVKLLELSSGERERLGKRLNFDVRPATYTEALAREEGHRSDVIRAAQQVRQASDELKRLLNDPELPLAGEIMIEPLDIPVDLPISISLYDAVTTAIRKRPEMQRALLLIKDASIRERVADNLRLPRLDATATMRYNGIGGSLWNASDLGNGNFIDYILGLEFEVPIGNRSAEALLKQRQLERQTTVVTYRDAGQTVVLEVKNAMRDLASGYELIGATRSARRAAAENLRAIQAEEDAGAALDAVFIDRKLRALESIAASEIQEVQALAAYNNAVSQYFRALGTLLERNGIEFGEQAAPVATQP